MKKMRIFRNHPPRIEGINREIYSGNGSNCEGGITITRTDKGSQL